MTDTDRLLKRIVLSGTLFFIGVACGYAWHMAAVG